MPDLTGSPLSPGGPLTAWSWLQEYLEAQFYSCAATGSPLDDSLTGSSAGTLTGCQKASLDTTTQAYAEELMQNEMTHVQFLRAALGPLAVSQPAIDIGAAFSTAANAAAGEGLPGCACCVHACTVRL